jgi:hypothetical protein
MKSKLLNVLAMAIFCCTALNAQQYAVGINVGTTGIGPDVAANFGKFGVRVGYYGLAFNGTYKNLTIPLSGIDVTGDVAGKVNASRFNILAEYGGLFRVFAGFSAPTGKELINATFTTTQPIKIAGYEIKPDPKTGTIGLGMGYKNAIQPIIGVSIGRAVPNKRVGFGADLGYVFTGKYKINSLTSAAGTTDLSGLQSKIAALSFLASRYPVLNLRLCVRLNSNDTTRD